MKKLLALAAILTSVSSYAAPTLSDGNLGINRVKYVQTLDFDTFEGVMTGIAKASGEGVLEGKKYILRASCGTHNAIKCNYNVDLVDVNTGVLKMNYLVGSLYGSQKKVFFEDSPSRKGKLNVLKEGEWFPSGTVGKFKLGDELLPRANDDTPNRGIRLRINLANPGEPEKMLNLDMTGNTHGSGANISKVEEYNTLSEDYHGRKIGGFVKVLEKFTGEKYIQSLTCMPSPRFGEWCTTSISEITANGRLEPIIQFGRIEGEKIYEDEYGFTVIPWRGYRLSGKGLYKVHRDVRFPGPPSVTRIREDGEIQHRVQGRLPDLTEVLETPNYFD